ncbi:MAG: hypothetical protein LBH05_09500 [Deferribacteraceae bacterium]|jgi:hypothetical protein|nr:hypothetical protein [Deferribacteraceae bacterium]
MVIKNAVKIIGVIALAVTMSVMIFSCSGNNSSGNDSSGNITTEDNSSDNNSSEVKKVGYWVTGDFHSHTNISDGSYRAAQVAAKAVEYGLDWYAATDHGGKFNRNDDGDDVGDRFRWETILGEAFEKIKQNRQSILQFNGFEMNAPGHEHASVGIVGDNDTSRRNLALFEYLFDASDSSSVTDLNPEMRTIADASRITKNTVNNQAKSLEAARWLQNNFAKTSYFLPNHPTRMLAGAGSGWLIKEIRELNDEAPDVFFGSEMLPGHQKSAFRGGLARFYYYDSNLGKIVQLSPGTANTLEEMVDNYISNTDPDTTKAEILDSLIKSVPKLRTYGGADFYAAIIGGVWDALLSEGRHYWIFGNSDFHTNIAGGGEPDYWPGEYSKIYTFVEEKSYQGILDGMRSGNTYSVLGDLINYLDYNIKVDNSSATMGETVSGAANAETVITISFKSPNRNNANTDGRYSLNDKPVVHHIDLIAGEVTGKAADYTVDSVTTTRIVTTFTEWDTDENGVCHITYTMPETDKNTYYRLRGTNLAPNTSGLTDSNGNPLVDTPFDSVRGTNTEDKPFKDLWFYTNPIFVNAD